MRPMFLRAAAVALALFAMPRAADAGWVSGFAGSAFITDNGGNPGTSTGNADGVINFAVYQIDSADWATTLGLSVNSLAGNITGGIGAYVYFYQVVNTVAPGGTGNLDRALDRLLLQGGGQVAGAGYSENTVFSDSSGAVGPNGFSAGANTGNYRLGADTSVAGTTLYAPTPTFTNAANAVEPDLFVWDDELRPTSGIAAYSFNFPGQSSASGPGLQPTQYSSIMFMVSSYAPKYSTGQLSDTRFGEGSVPVPSPEPATIAMFGMALPLLGFGYLRRQKTKAEPAIA